MLCVLDNTFVRDAFTITFLSAYTWYINQYYVIEKRYANRLSWECLKPDLQLYLKPPNYA